MPASLREGATALTRRLAENILKVYRDLKPTEAFRRHTHRVHAGSKRSNDGGGVYNHIATLSGASNKAGKMLARRDQSAETRRNPRGHERRKPDVRWRARSGGRLDRILRRERQRHRGDDHRPPPPREAEGRRSDDPWPRSRRSAATPRLVPSRDVRRKAHFDEKQFQAVIHFLHWHRPPSPVEITEEVWTSGNWNGQEAVAAQADAAVGEGRPA